MQLWGHRGWIHRNHSYKRWTECMAPLHRALLARLISTSVFSGRLFICSLSVAICVCDCKYFSQHSTQLKYQKRSIKIQHFIIVSLKYEHTISIKKKKPKQTYEATIPLHYREFKENFIWSSPWNRMREEWCVCSFLKVTIGCYCWKVLRSDSPLVKIWILAMHRQAQLLCWRYHGAETGSLPPLTVQNHGLKIHVPNTYHKQP